MVLERERVFTRSLFYALSPSFASLAREVVSSSQCGRIATLRNHLPAAYRRLFWSLKIQVRKVVPTLGEGPTSGACALRLYMRVCRGREREWRLEASWRLLQRRNRPMAIARHRRNQAAAALAAAAFCLRFSTYPCFMGKVMGMMASHDVRARTSRALSGGYREKEMMRGACCVRAP